MTSKTFTAKIAAAAIALHSLGAPATLPVAATLGTAAILSTAASTAEAGQCGARLSVIGVGATGAIFKLKKRRAERRAIRGWRAVVAGEPGPTIFTTTHASHLDHASYDLGTRYADIDNARNVVINCEGGKIMVCTVTATPCTG